MDFKKLAPSEIRYSQDSISNTFRSGQNIGETLDEIVSDPDTANRIPKISVFNKDDKWFTSDNRRLWVFKKAEELGIVRSIDVDVTYEIEDSKFTTTSDGKYVRIRGGSPGGKEWQSLEENVKEQKRQEVKQQRERKREQQMEIERQQREREQQMEIERQQREREQQMEIERQRRKREQQMEIERQQRNKNIVIGLIVSFIVIYLGMRHHHSN